MHQSEVYHSANQLIKEVKSDYVYFPLLKIWS